MNNIELLKWLIDVSITINDNKKEAKKMLDFAIKDLQQQLTLTDIGSSFPFENSESKLCKTCNGNGFGKSRKRIY